MSLPDPLKVNFSNEFKEMLKLCYSDDIEEFRIHNKLTAPLFRIIRVRLIIAGLLIQRCEAYVGRADEVIPIEAQVSCITKIFRNHFNRGLLS